MTLAGLGMAGEGWQPQQTCLAMWQAVKGPTNSAAVYVAFCPTSRMALCFLDACLQVLMVAPTAFVFNDQAAQVGRASTLLACDMHPCAATFAHATCTAAQVCEQRRSPALRTAVLLSNRNLKQALCIPARRTTHS